MKDYEVLASRDDALVFSARCLIYSLKHTQHELGMFIQVLKENGIKSPAWSMANMM